MLDILKYWHRHMHPHFHLTFIWLSLGINGRSFSNSLNRYEVLFAASNNCHRSPVGHCFVLFNRHVAQIPQCTSSVSRKLGAMHHFVTEICTCVHISVRKWCIVGYMTNAQWDLRDGSISWYYTVLSSCHKREDELVITVPADSLELCGERP